MPTHAPRFRPPAPRQLWSGHGLIAAAVALTLVACASNVELAFEREAASLDAGGDVGAPRDGALDAPPADGPLTDDGSIVDGGVPCDEDAGVPCNDDAASDADDFDEGINDGGGSFDASLDSPSDARGPGDGGPG